MSNTDAQFGQTIGGITDKTYNDLSETASIMNSSDYKIRLVAEYVQTKIRYEKLHNMIVKYDANKLDFEPMCPIDLLRQQKRTMGQYLYSLEVRMLMEDIKRPVVEVS